MSTVPMSKTERRKGARYEVSFPVSLSTVNGALDGQAINASPQGVLLEAQGRLSVQLTIKGQDYRGWLVRAEQDEGGSIAYAIELEDYLELSEK